MAQGQVINIYYPVPVIAMEYGLIKRNVAQIW